MDRARVELNIYRKQMRRPRSGWLGLPPGMQYFIESTGGRAGRYYRIRMVFAISVPLSDYIIMSQTNGNYALATRSTFANGYGRTQADVNKGSSCAFLSFGKRSSFFLIFG